MGFSKKKNKESAVLTKINRQDEDRARFEEELKQKYIEEQKVAAANQQRKEEKKEQEKSAKITIGKQEIADDFDAAIKPAEKIRSSFSIINKTKVDTPFTQKARSIYQKMLGNMQKDKFNYDLSDYPRAQTQDFTSYADEKLQLHEAITSLHSEWEKASNSDERATIKLMIAELLEHGAHSAKKTATTKLLGDENIQTNKGEQKLTLSMVRGVSETVEELLSKPVLKRQESIPVNQQENKPVVKNKQVQSNIVLKPNQNSSTTELDNRKLDNRKFFGMERDKYKTSENDFSLTNVVTKYKAHFESPAGDLSTTQKMKSLLRGITGNEKKRSSELEFLNNIEKYCNDPGNRMDQVQKNKMRLTAASLVLSSLKGDMNSALKKELKSELNRSGNSSAVCDNASLRVIQLMDTKIPSSLSDANKKACKEFKIIPQKINSSDASSHEMKL